MQISAARYNEKRNPSPIALEDGASDLGEVTARWADFSQPKMAKSFVVQTNFIDAILKNASFHNADLRHGMFERTKMQGVDLSQTNLGCASFK